MGGRKRVRDRGRNREGSRVMDEGGHHLWYPPPVIEQWPHHKASTTYPSLPYRTRNIFGLVTLALPSIPLYAA